MEVRSSPEDFVNIKREYFVVNRERDVTDPLYVQEAYPSFHHWCPSLSGNPAYAPEHIPNKR